MQEHLAELELYQTELGELENNLTASISAKQALEHDLAQLGTIDFNAIITGIEADIVDAKAAIKAIDFQLIENPDQLLFAQEISVVEQIDLINQIKDATLNRYTAELELIEEVESVAVDIKQFLKDLAFSDVSPLTSMERLTSAQNNFSDNLVNIFSENTGLAAEARNNLLDSANTLLDEASGVFAIGSEYQDIYNFVTESLANLNLDPGEINTTEIDRLRTETLTQLQALDDILYELEEFNNNQLNLEVQLLGETFTLGLLGITTKLDQINDESWIPIKNALTGLGSFDSGTDEVKFDQLAKIHKGELILNPETSEEVRTGGALITNTDNSSINNIGGGTDNTEVVIAISNLTDALLATQADIIDLQEKILIQGSETQSIFPVASTRGIL